MGQTILVQAMPAGEVLLSDAIHDLDAYLINEGTSAVLNIKEGTDEATNVGRNFHNAVNILDFSESLNCGFGLGFVGVWHIKSFFILDAFFNHSRRSQLGVVILADEDHDSYGISFLEKRFQVGPLEIGIEPGRDEILVEKLHG